MTRHHKCPSTHRSLRLIVPKYCFQSTFRSTVPRMNRQRSLTEAVRTSMSVGSTARLPPVLAS
jgi:hypothetical protein